MGSPNHNCFTLSEYHYYLSTLFCWIFFAVDFFDTGVVPGMPLAADKAKTEPSTKKREVKPEAMANKLPEGFFDDAKMDAKV